jgi:uncharacterized protein
VTALRMRSPVWMLVLCVVLASSPAPAARLSSPADSKPPETAPRSAQSGPGVPPLTGPVVDEAHILSVDAQRVITSLAHELKEKTGAEFAVLTIDSVAPGDIFDYGLAVADRWKLGTAGRDDGLLMLVVVSERQVRFFTGYGLEGVLTDGRLGSILDKDVTPRFRTGDYDTGIYAGLRSAAEIVAADAGVTLTGSPPGPRERRVDQVSWLPVVFVFVLALFAIVDGITRRRRRRNRFFPIFFGGGLGGRGGGLGGGFGGGFGGGGRFGGGGAGRGW